MDRRGKAGGKEDPDQASACLPLLRPCARWLASLMHPYPFVLAALLLCWQDRAQDRTWLPFSYPPSLL